MPIAIGCESSPSNSASMAASEVVKQHADAMPCSERPSIITPNVSLHAHSADAMAKPTTPISSTGRAPTRSAMRPIEQQRGREREARHADDRARDRGRDAQVGADGRQQHDDAVHVDRQRDHGEAEREQRQPAGGYFGFTRVGPAGPSATAARTLRGTVERATRAARRPPVTERVVVAERRRRRRAGDVRHHRGQERRRVGRDRRAAHERDAPEVGRLHARRAAGDGARTVGRLDRDVGAARMPRVEQRDGERVLAPGELGAGVRERRHACEQLQVHQRDQRVQHDLFVLTRTGAAPQQVVGERAREQRRAPRPGSAR